MAAASAAGGTMVGAIANSAVAARRLIAAPAVATADPGGAEAPAGLAGAGGWAAGWPPAGDRAIAGLGSPGVVPETGRDATDPGTPDPSVARALGREDAATDDGTTGLTGSPGTGPPHIMVLAGEIGLFAPSRPATGDAMTIALPHAWQRITGCVVSGWVAGSGAWQ
jgi:hypothetical protein